MDVNCNSAVFAYTVKYHGISYVNYSLQSVIGFNNSGVGTYLTKWLCLYAFLCRDSDSKATKENKPYRGSNYSLYTYTHSSSMHYYHSQCYSIVINGVPGDVHCCRDARLMIRIRQCP